MDPIEKAIRGAFEKGDAEDRAYRERVYRSAFAALDRALKSNPNVTVEAAINRRKALEAKIAEIETEFLPAVPAVDLAEASTASVESQVAPVEQPSAMRREPEFAERPAVAAPEPAAFPSAGQAGPSDIPAVTLDRPLAGNAAPSPVLRADGAMGQVSAPQTVAPPRRSSGGRGRRLAGMFLIVTLLAAIAIGIGWGLQTGLIKIPAEGDTPTPPPVASESEDFIPEEEGAPGLPGQADPERNWVTVFDPANADAVTAPADARAEVMQDDTGQFLRVRSGASGSAVIFDVGQGVLENIAGRKATFDIVARAEEGKETEMMVDCNFGELGDCGRKRYSVTYEQADFLFELDLPRASPGSGGTIAINSDFGNGGKAVDIYMIRVSTSE